MQLRILDQRQVDFEYDGEMSPDVALEPSIRALYPFCRLTGDANVLVVPGLHSAHIAARLAHHLGGGTTIGPLLIGMEKPVQIVPMDASSARSSIWRVSLPTSQSADSQLTLLGAPGSAEQGVRSPVRLSVVVAGRFAAGR